MKCSPTALVARPERAGIPVVELAVRRVHRRTHTNSDGVAALADAQGTVIAEGRLSCGTSPTRRSATCVSIAGPLTSLYRG